MDSAIPITDQVAIPEDELRFTASRSGGPGGQNVNKVSTRVTLWFDLLGSPSLSDADKDRIARRLGGRVGKDGVLRVVSQQTRSQAANRELALARFVELLRAALTPLPVRRKTRATLAARLRRLEHKKLHGARKRERTAKVGVED